MADFPADFYHKRGPVFMTHDAEDYVAVFAPKLADLTPPIVDQISPDPEAPSTPRNATLSFRLRDNGGFTVREILARFGDSVFFDWVHDGTEYKGKYANSTTTPVAGGWVYAITRDGGWPAGKRVKLRLYVVDAGGNLVVIDA